MKDKKILCIIIFLTILTSVSVSAEDMLIFSRPLAGVSLVRDGREKRIIQTPHQLGAKESDPFDDDGADIISDRARFATYSRVR